MNMGLMDLAGLAARVDKLERRNRMLSAICIALLTLPLLAVLGWHGASDTLKVKRLEVVDSRGVPLITLAATRDSSGGSIVLRDAAGEKRGWFESGLNTATLTLNSETPDGSGDSTLGLAVGMKSAKLSMISRSGALLSAGISSDAPRIDLWNPKGTLLFGAPWKK